MSENNFSSGFVVGSILGGVVGGVLGTLLATRNSEGKATNSSQQLAEGAPPFEFASEAEMEVARHSLEDKIAQLNLAIDEVRQQLGSVSGVSSESD